MMSPETSSPSFLLEEALRRTMAGGIELTEEVCRFMAATFGEASADALRALLEDDANTERDSLLDLIYFPDQSFQIAIEPLLEKHPLTKGDVDQLARRLEAKPLATCLRFPGADAAVPAAMPFFLVDAFLKRLNLAWQPVAALDQAFSRLDARPLSPTGDRREGRARLRVWLRNADLRQTPVQVRFLADFFARLPPETETFVDNLRFILVFMKEHEEATNLYEALMERKRFIFRHLLKTRRSAEVAARSNMETLILTGVRTPHFDIVSGEQTLALIDSIAMAVFGRTEVLAGAPREVELGDQAERLEPAELIRRLS